MAETERTDEEALAQDVLHAQQADAILNNPLFASVFSLYRDRLIEEWCNSSARDQDGRELLWRQLQALLIVEKTFRGMVEDGRIAAEELSDKNRAKAN